MNQLGIQSFCYDREQQTAGIHDHILVLPLLQSQLEILLKLGLRKLETDYQIAWGLGLLGEVQHNDILLLLHDGVVDELLQFSCVIRQLLFPTSPILIM